MDRNHGGLGVQMGYRGIVPGAAVLTGLRDGRRKVTGPDDITSVSLLCHGPKQLTKHLSKLASRVFTHSSSCSENTAEIKRDFFFFLDFLLKLGE